MDESLEQELWRLRAMEVSFKRLEGCEQELERKKSEIIPLQKRCTNLQQNLDIAIEEHRKFAHRAGIVQKQLNYKIDMGRKRARFPQIALLSFYGILTATWWVWFGFDPTISHIIVAFIYTLIFTTGLTYRLCNRAGPYHELPDEEKVIRII